MSYAVVEFEDDSKVCAIPASWFFDGNVHLPPVGGRNLRIAIMQAIPPSEDWEAHAASCFIHAETYDLAAAYAKKFSVNEEDSDTSPCRGMVRRRRPKPIRRYTPNPTDEEAHNTELRDTLPLLHSTIISPVAGPSSAPAAIYPVMRALSSSERGPLNLSQTAPKSTGPTASADNTASMETILQAIKSMELNVLSRMDNYDRRAAALDQQISNYHSDVLNKAINTSPTKTRWSPWFPLQSLEELKTMEANLRNEKCRSEVVHFVQRTQSGEVIQRTKSCLRRLLSDQLATRLSWQATTNRQAFGTTCLCTIMLETLASSCSEGNNLIPTMKQTCVQWFHNARDRSGGRAKRRYTCPKMPLLEVNDENKEGDAEDRV